MQMFKEYANGSRLTVGTLAQLFIFPFVNLKYIICVTCRCSLASCLCYLSRLWTMKCCSVWILFPATRRGNPVWVETGWCFSFCDIFLLWYALIDFFTLFGSLHVLPFRLKLTSLTSRATHIHQEFITLHLFLLQVYIIKSDFLSWCFFPHRLLSIKHA